MQYSIIRDIGLPGIVSAVISSIWGLLIFVLQQRAQKSLEKFKRQLDISVSDHEMRFGLCHPKRAEVLECTYSALYDSFVALRRLTSGVDLSDIEKMRINIDFVDKNIRSFLEAFAHKKIYLSFNLTEKLEEIYDLMRADAFHYWSIIAHAEMKISNNQEVPVAEIEREAFAQICKISENVRGPMKKRLMEIETEFRNILEALPVAG